MRRRIALRIALVATCLVLLGTTVSAAPVAGRVHFSAVGDLSAGANAGAVLNLIDDLDSDLTVALGDLSYGTTGAEQAWCDFVTSRVGAGYPFELLAGNHESNGQNGHINDFSACLPNQLPGLVGTYGRQYFVDVPAADPLVRFVMISPDLTFPDGLWSYAAGSPRYQWTADAIDAARAAGVDWVVVGMHKPCLSVGQYACDPGADLFNLLITKKVDLILSGHEHGYMRSKQLAVRPGCPAVTPDSFDADCVADADAVMVKGAGSVSAVVGTGGIPLRDVNAGDPDAGYFAVTSGLNANPTWGVLDLSATTDELRATFARAAGGTQSDTFTITRNATPNVPPVAAISTTCADLTCAVDASGSSDPDGTITAYAWSFGDGGTASGPSASHTYAAAGSYPITLTVTDSDGASASSTRTVAVTAPATTTYAADSFARTVAAGWGTAPTGGAWTVSNASLFGVAAGVGSIRTAAGSGPLASLNTVSALGSDLRATVALDKVPTGSGLYLSMLGRRTSAGAYAAKARVTSTGTVTLELARRGANGAETSLQGAVIVPGLTYAAGDRLNLRLQLLGSSPTTVRAKLWRAGTPEPDAWQRSVVDATAGLQAAGSVGISPYLSSAAINAPITVTVNDLTVTAP